MSIKRQLFLCAGLFLFVVATGVAGYSLIEGWDLFDSLYMTIITITTVGFKEVHPLSDGGRAFTMVLALLGLGIVLYIVTAGARVVIEGEFQQFLGRRKVEKKIKNLRGHYIICGFGRMGRIIAREFSSNGLEFVTIEKEPLPEALADSRTLFMQGDATRDEVLLEAGITSAAGLVTVLPTDAENLYVVLTAKGLNPGLRVVARAGEEGSEQKLLRAGADRVVSPYHIGGLRIAHSVIKPAVVDFIEFATKSGNIELQMEEVPVQEGSSVEGRSLDESGIGRELGVIVVAVKRPGEEMKFNPTYRSVLKRGDVLIALGEAQRLKELEAMAGKTA